MKARLGVTPFVCLISQIEVGCKGLSLKTVVRTVKREANKRPDSEQWRHIETVEFGPRAITETGEEVVLFGGWIDVLERAGAYRFVIRWPPDPTLGREVEPLTMDVPPGIINTEDEFRELREAAYNVFNGFWRRVMVFETEQHFRDSVNWALSHLQLSSVDVKDVIDHHLRASATDLRVRFRLPPSGRGQPTKWDEITLVTEVRAILNALDQDQKDSYLLDLINKELKKRHPGRAPKNGESLRKLLGSFGYTLKKIKKATRGK